MAAGARFALDYALTPEGWIVTDRETGIYGCAESPSEALKDFSVSAREHLQVLERQDALSESLEAQRDYLRARLA